jgi:hypothetical protein
VAKGTELTEKQVTNTIYNKSKRPAYIIKIAKFLNLDPEKILSTKNAYPINIDCYTKASQIVLSVITENKITTVDSANLQSSIDKTYKYLHKEKDEKMTNTYVRGMIETLIENSIIRK